MERNQWLIDLYEDESLWVDENTICLPPIIKDEYVQLKRLFKDGKTIGAIFELKDILELSIKLPVIFFMATTLQNGKVASEYSDPFKILLSGPLSTGHWLMIAKKLYKMTESNLIFDSLLKSIIDDFSTNNIKNGSFNIAEWRNRRIGHGAFTEHFDEKFKEEVKALLKLLKRHLHDNSDLFDKIHISLDTKDALIDINNSENLPDEGEILINMGEGIISLSPFIIRLNGKFFIYDSFIGNGKVGYLDYQSADKIKLLVKEINNIHADLCHIEKVDIKGSRSDLIFEEDEYNYLSSNIKDLVKPTYLLDKVKYWIEHYTKGIFCLRMDAGMGKSTFVKMLDPLLKEQLKTSPIKLPEVSVRCFYINNSYSSELTFFKDSIKRVFLQTDNGRVLRGHDTSFANKKEFAEFLNYFGREYEALSIAGHDLGSKVLLFVDAIDESFQEGRSDILDIIPSPDMLSDNIYIIITSRTNKNLDYLIRKNLDNVVFSDIYIVEADDYNNRKLINQYMQQYLSYIHINNKAYMESALGNTFLEANIIKYIPDELKRYIVLSEDDLFRLFFDKIGFFYSEKYYIKIKNILALLALSEIPLSVNQILDALDNSIEHFQLLCIINDLSPVLIKHISGESVKYTINHLQIKKFIITHFSYEIEILLMNFLNQIIDKYVEKAKFNTFDFIRFLLVFKYMKYLNPDCYYGEMHRYEFYGELIPYFIEQKSLFENKFTNDYLYYIYIEIGLAIFNSFDCGAGFSSTNGYKCKYGENWGWIMPIALGIVASGLYFLGEQKLAYRMIEIGATIFKGKTNNTANLAESLFIELFKNIEGLSSHYHVLTEEYLKKLGDIKLNNNDEEDDLFDFLGLNYFRVSPHSLFEGPRECFLSILDSFIEFLGEKKPEDVDNINIRSLLIVLKAIATNHYDSELLADGDSYESFDELLKAISYKEFLDIFLSQFNEDEELNEYNVRLIDCCISNSKNNSFSVYEKDCIRRCIDSLVNPDPFGRSPLFGHNRPSFVKLFKDSKADCMNYSFIFPVDIGLLRIYLSELYHVLKSKIFYSKKGYFPICKSYIYSTPLFLSLGGTSPSFDKLNKLVVPELSDFYNNVIKMSKFDENWLMLRSMSTLSSNTILKLRFLCDNVGKSVYKENYNEKTCYGDIQRFRLKEDVFEMWRYSTIHSSHIHNVFKVILNEFQNFYKKIYNKKISSYEELLVVLDEGSSKASLLKDRLVELNKLYRKFRQDKRNIMFFIKRLQEILFEQKLIFLINEYFSIILKAQNMKSIIISNDFNVDNYENTFILNMTYGEKIELENKRN